jgi:hypothetical protein
VLSVVGTTLTSFLTVYLAHSRIKRDKVQAMRFMDQRIQLEQIHQGVQETNESLSESAQTRQKNGD